MTKKDFFFPEYNKESKEVEKKLAQRSHCPVCQRKVVEGRRERETERRREKRGREGERREEEKRRETPQEEEEARTKGYTFPKPYTP